MAMIRKLTAKVSEQEDDYSFDSFKKNIKRQWEERGSNRVNQKRAEIIPKLLLLFQCPSQLYIFVNYIVPRLFEEYTEVTIVLLQLFGWFCCIEGLMNYFCCLFATSYVTRHHAAKMETSQGHTNGTVPNGVAVPRDDGELSWHFCDECNMNVPPRAHHCKICDKCILKRDHHCFMIGTCIGFHNQRYFFVLGFYAIMCGLVGLFFNAYYLYTFFWPVTATWANLFPPVAMFRWYYEYEDIEPHILILIWQAYTQLFFGMFGIVVFHTQLTMCILGKTSHEITNYVPIKNSNTISQNIASVFGPHFIANFCFPSSFCFRQKGDGCRWDGIKVEHNPVKAEEEAQNQTVVEINE